MDGIHESRAELRRMRREARRDPDVWQAGRSFLPSPLVPMVAFVALASIVLAFLALMVTLGDMPWGQLLGG